METKNVERFIHGTVHFFRIIGFQFDNKDKRMEIYLIVGLINFAIIILGQILFVAFQKVDLQQQTTNITFLNYFLVSCAKIISIMYNRKIVNEILNEFRAIYPDERMEKAYNLKKYLKQYVIIENVLAGFFKSITWFYCAFPFMLSIVELVRSGKFTFNNLNLYMMWFVVDLPIQSNVLYVISYISQIHASYVSSATILSLDLCLFSSMFQLCMHFDVIKKNILLMEPDGSHGAAFYLRTQIAYHQRLLRLADKLNAVFTPSVLFSLLSSSLIICFTGFQLLGDFSLLIVVKAIFLLAYELKQVAITCFLGDKLIENSLKISDAIYSHKWYNGTPKYRRLVLMVLMRSQKGVALNIAGISDISLQTFRRVMSISYQIFTVLKTAA